MQTKPQHSVAGKMRGEMAYIPHSSSLLLLSDKLQNIQGKGKNNGEIELDEDGHYL